MAHFYASITYAVLNMQRSFDKHEWEQIRSCSLVSNVRLVVDHLSVRVFSGSEDQSLVYFAWAHHFFLHFYHYALVYSVCQDVREFSNPDSRLAVAGRVHTRFLHITMLPLAELRPLRWASRPHVALVGGHDTRLHLVCLHAINQFVRSFRQHRHQGNAAQRQTRQTSQPGPAAGLDVRLADGRSMLDLSLDGLDDVDSVRVGSE